MRLDDGSMLRLVGLWKKLRRKPDQPSDSSVNAGAGPRRPDPRETYARKVDQIPTRYTSVPEGYVVQHLNWEEYKDSGLPDAEIVGEFPEVMSPKDLQNVWFDVLRDPDGNVVAERDQSGGRWWTPEELEAEKQAWWEFEDEL